MGATPPRYVSVSCPASTRATEVPCLPWRLGSG
ncbi:Uncharacterised protein [Bordetella pertussis]|nr:Uncharacterised protein [Bordetella pertussis]